MPNELVIKTPFRQYTTELDPSLGFHPILSGGGTVYLCECCLRFFKSAGNLISHCSSCSNAFWIPGDEIYRDPRGKYCVFEIDGRKHVSALFAKRVAVVTKIFLADKQTLDDVHFFTFNALFEIDDFGYHFVGHFSREWCTSRDYLNTLSCVVVLPPYRGAGYGRALVELSYELARRDGMVGTPERPLSSDGGTLFCKAWKWEVQRAVRCLENSHTPVTIASLCSQSGMIVEDTLVGLEANGFLYTMGKQGPIIVFNDSAASPSTERSSAGHISSDFVEWPPTF